MEWRKEVGIEGEERGVGEGGRGGGGVWGGGKRGTLLLGWTYRLGGGSAGKARGQRAGEGGVDSGATWWWWGYQGAMTACKHEIGNFQKSGQTAISVVCVRRVVIWAVY